MGSLLRRCGWGLGARCPAPQRPAPACRKAAETRAAPHPAALRLRTRLVLLHLVGTVGVANCWMGSVSSQDPRPGRARGISVLSAFRSCWQDAEGWPAP